LQVIGHWLKISSTIVSQLIEGAAAASVTVPYPTKIE
jgi:hypothetical protein